MLWNFWWAREALLHRHCNPFFTPMLMLLRICILLPPFIQVLGSICLLILTTLFMIWLSAKIYRVGILMYGKPPKFAEIVKWIRYK